jgi:hypothetical protein
MTNIKIDQSWFQIPPYGGFQGVSSGKMGVLSDNIICRFLSILTYEIIKITLILLLKRFKGISRGFQEDFKEVSRGKLLDSAGIVIYIFLKSI